MRVSHTLPGSVSSLRAEVSERWAEAGGDRPNPGLLGSFPFHSSANGRGWCAGGSPSVSGRGWRSLPLFLMVEACFLDVFAEDVGHRVCVCGCGRPRSVRPLRGCRSRRDLGRTEALRVCDEEGGCGGGGGPAQPFE